MNALLSRTGTLYLSVVSTNLPFVLTVSLFRRCTGHMRLYVAGPFSCVGLFRPDTLSSYASCVPPFDCTLYLDTLGSCVLVKEPRMSYAAGRVATRLASNTSPVRSIP
jgi:hypothetical protein